MLFAVFHCIAACAFCCVVLSIALAPELREKVKKPFLKKSTVGKRVPILGTGSVYGPFLLFGSLFSVF